MTQSPKSIDPSNAALVLIDLQRGVTARQLAPRSAADVVRTSAALAAAFRQWGAFYGTGLDLQLRRRGRRTIVLGGIATNFGVESTARDGWERGYRLLLVEDAMASMSADDHAFAVKRIFPRLGHVCAAQDVIAGLGN